MPILGLSDRGSVDPRFREIGRLRKGAAKDAQGRVGRDLEWFRFVPHRGKEDIAEAFVKAYGEKPTELEVYFPFERMEQVFSSYREAYGQNRLCKLRCDGANWIDWIEGDRHYHSEQGKPCTFDYKDVENRCPKCPCGYYGRLSVILPDLWLLGKIGLVTVMTTSINDIATLSAKLVQWEPLVKKPFTLWRSFERIGVPINGQRAAKEMSLLHLELKEEQLIQAFLAAQEEHPMLEDGRLPFDEPPIEDDYDEGLVAGDEFLEDEPKPEEEPEPVEYVQPPRNLNHKNIVRLAVQHLPGYENEGAVMTGLLDVVGKDWKKNTEWSVSQAWAELQDRMRAPAG